MKTILVALDASPFSLAVLDRAIELARTTSARLVLLRAVAIPPAQPMGIYAMPQDLLGKALVDAGRRDLADLERIVPEAMRQGARVVLETPWRAICDAAKATDADLVVIGSHGYNALDRVLGTTAARVVNHIDRSVLVVRPRPEQGVGAGPHSSLRSDHERLEKTLEDLRARALSDDWREVDAAWPAFCAGLEAHFHHEENEVFPAYARIGAGERTLCEGLRAQHDAIRRRIELLGIEIQTHAIRATTIDQLVADLRRHAGEESRALYPWLEAGGAGRAQ